MYLYIYTLKQYTSSATKISLSIDEYDNRDFSSGPSYTEYRGNEKIEYTLRLYLLKGNIHHLGL